MKLRRGDKRVGQECRTILNVLGPRQRDCVARRENRLPLRPAGIWNRAISGAHGEGQGCAFWDRRVPLDREPGRPRLLGIEDFRCVGPFGPIAVRIELSKPDSPIVTIRTRVIEPTEALHQRWASDPHRFPRLGRVRSQEWLVSFEPPVVTIVGTCPANGGVLGLAPFPVQTPSRGSNRSPRVSLRIPGGKSSLSK